MGNIHSHFICTPIPSCTETKCFFDIDRVQQNQESSNKTNSLYEIRSIRTQPNQEMLTKKIYNYIKVRLCPLPQMFQSLGCSSIAPPLSCSGTSPASLGA